MNTLKANAPAMREADFRKILDALFVKKPNGTVLTAVTRYMALDIDFDAAKGHQLGIVPETDVSSTPDGVPFCTFVVTNAGGHLVKNGFIYWDEESYALRARISSAPYKAIVKDGDVNGRNIDAMAAAMRYFVKADYPGLFPNEWKDCEAPIYVRRGMLRTLSENGYAPSDANVAIYYAETMRLLNKKSKGVSPFQVNAMAFEDACLFYDNDYGEAQSDAFDGIEDELETSDDRLPGVCFEIDYFADPTSNWAPEAA